MNKAKVLSEQELDEIKLITKHEPMIASDIVDLLLATIAARDREIAELKQCLFQMQNAAIDLQQQLAEANRLLVECTERISIPSGKDPDGCDCFFCRLERATGRKEGE